MLINLSFICQITFHYKNSLSSNGKRRNTRIFQYQKAAYLCHFTAYREWWRKYPIFSNIVKINKITEDKDEFRNLISLILLIVNNHHINSNFFTNIEKKYYTSQKLKESFSNEELYYLFKLNKLVLLFLSEAKIIELNEINNNIM